MHWISITIWLKRWRILIFEVIFKKSTLTKSESIKMQKNRNLHVISTKTIHILLKKIAECQVECQIVNSARYEFIFWMRILFNEINMIWVDVKYNAYEMKTHEIVDIWFENWHSIRDFSNNFLSYFFFIFDYVNKVFDVKFEKFLKWDFEM